MCDGSICTVQNYIIYPHNMSLSFACSVNEEIEVLTNFGVHEKFWKLLPTGLH